MLNVYFSNFNSLHTHTHTHTWMNGCHFTDCETNKGSFSCYFCETNLGRDFMTRETSVCPETPPVENHGPRVFLPCGKSKQCNQARERRPFLNRSPSALGCSGGSSLVTAETTLPALSVNLGWGWGHYVKGAAIWGWANQDGAFKAVACYVIFASATYHCKR